MGLTQPNPTRGYRGLGLTRQHPYFPAFGFEYKSVSTTSGGTTTKTECFCGCAIMPYLRDPPALLSLFGVGLFLGGNLLARYLQGNLYDGALTLALASMHLKLFFVSALAAMILTKKRGWLWEAVYVVFVCGWLFTAGYEVHELLKSNDSNPSISDQSQPRSFS